MDRKIGVLGLVNYRDHPTDKRYKVFSFYKKHEADLFQKTLEEEKVKFEMDEDEVKDKTIYFFAIDKINFTKAQKANYKVSAEFRNKIIKNGVLRYALLIIVFSAIGLGIFGYVKNMEKLENRKAEIELNNLN